MSGYPSRKHYPKRQRKTLSKAYVMSKKGNTDQSKQILALQRQVTAIKRDVGDRQQYVQYQTTSNQPAIGHGAALASTWQPAIYRCISPDQWQPIFQTPSLTNPGTDGQNKFRGRSIGFEHMIQLEDPEGQNGDPVTCTLFCVSLRKETAQQFLTQSQFFTALNQPRDYVQTSMGAVQGSGLCMLNKGIFKIRYSKRFMIGSRTDFDGTASTTSLMDNNQRIYTKINYPNVIKSGRGDEPWKELALNEVEATDQLCWLLFHNAYDTQLLSWNCNAVVTGQLTN